MALSRERLRPRGMLPCLMLAFLLCIGGCGGCRSTPDAEEQARKEAAEEAKKKEKDVKPFEARQPVALPTAGSFPGTCKPGHWSSQVWPEVRSNLGDFPGELQTDVVDRSNRKALLADVNYVLASRRPAPLAKEQPKSLETLLWIPPCRDPQTDARMVDFRLQASGGGITAIERSLVLQPMKSYQYFFIVLARSGRYDYLEKRLASIRERRSSVDSGAGRKSYEVVTLPPAKRPELPSGSLFWTSIAYVLWDESDPTLWDPEQQRALIDWLHWGGQIIVSGPDALEQLQGSFLRPYLPATAAKARTFDARDIDPLSYWSGEIPAPPQQVRPWVGAELKIDPQARELPETGGLFVERQVGRGRIVASAVRLTGPELTGWAGFDCLFNACLLRRPAREILVDRDLKTRKPHWPGEIRNHSRLPMADAARNTAVRFFARDAGVEPAAYAADTLRADPAPPLYPGMRPAPIVDGPGAGFDEDGFDDEDPDFSRRRIASGLGAWNDFSPVAKAARVALNDAGGITVPPRSFVIWVIAGYLVVLVPVNWLVFRLIGRVEWAWIGAPLLAIGCTLIVVQQARLNIGFARSLNEIAVVEMQPGYSRAHVACYTALYTSLATHYELRLADRCGQILPFPLEDSPGRSRPNLWPARGELVCRRGDDTVLSGFRVASNMADFVHSEQMIDFGGTVALHEDGPALRVTNRTQHPLEACKVLRGRPFGGVDIAEIGRLEPGATKRLAGFATRADGSDASAPTAAEAVPSGELTVEGVEEVAIRNLGLREGQVCLLGRVADGVPGLLVAPATQQTRQAALLVAHLSPGKLPRPVADKDIEAPRSPAERPGKLLPDLSNPDGPFPLPRIDAPDAMSEDE